jgi:prepilin-type N-terminal cleavage/methylation domain-containing protein
MKHRAFTIIELILTIAILGVLAGGIGPGVSAAINTYDRILNRRQMLAEAEAGMERMVREIRLIPGSSQVTSAATTSFQFQYPTGTSITYSLSGTNLSRNSDILLANISSLAFTYYTQAGATTTTAASVRSVGIQFTMTSSGSTPSLTLSTRVFIRNTGNNYVNFTSP